MTEEQRQEIREEGRKAYYRGSNENNRFWDFLKSDYLMDATMRVFIFGYYVGVMEERNNKKE